MVSKSVHSTLSGVVSHAEENINIRFQDCMLGIGQVAHIDVRARVNLLYWHVHAAAVVIVHNYVRGAAKKSPLNSSVYLRHHQSSALLILPPPNVAGNLLAQRNAGESFHVNANVYAHRRLPPRTIRTTSSIAYAANLRYTMNTHVYARTVESSNERQCAGATSLFFLSVTWTLHRNHYDSAQ